MLIEAISDTCKVKFQGRVIVLEPGQPVDVPAWVVEQVLLLPDAEGQVRIIGSCRHCASRVFYSDGDCLCCAYCRPPHSAEVSWIVVTS